MRQLAILLSVVAGSLFSPPIHAQTPALREVRRFYIEGYDKALEKNRLVADCLMTKLKERGPFTFETSKEAVDAVLTVDVTIPGGSSRILWGKSPSVRVSVVGPDGRILWKGENNYKKGTTVWGAATDIPCGLANGIADKLVKAMQGK